MPWRSWANERACGVHGGLALCLLGVIAAMVAMVVGEAPSSAERWCIVAVNGAIVVDGFWHVAREMRRG